MWFVYIIQCRDKSFYTGLTRNLAQRVEDHKEGKGARYVNIKGFDRLVYWEETADRSAAEAREKQIKRLERKRKKHLVNCFQLKHNAK